MDKQTQKNIGIGQTKILTQVTPWNDSLLPKHFWQIIWLNHHQEYFEAKVVNDFIMIKWKIFNQGKSECSLLLSNAMLSYQVCLSFWIWRKPQNSLSLFVNNIMIVPIFNSTVMWSLNLIIFPVQVTNLKLVSCHSVWFYLSWIKIIFCWWCLLKKIWCLIHSETKTFHWFDRLLSLADLFKMHKVLFKNATVIWIFNLQMW